MFDVMMMIVFLKSTMRPLTVGQPAVIHDLQQDVKYVLVRLFDLVEQNHRIRAAAHLLGELPPFFVADVSRRRADQARHRVPLHVFGHIDAHQGVFVIKQEFGESAGEFSFSDASRTEENKRPNWSLRDR